MAIGASLWGLVNQTLENGATMRTQRALATKYNYTTWKLESPIFPLVRAAGFNVKDWQDLILVNQVGKRFYDETKGDVPHGNCGGQIMPCTPNDYRNTEKVKFAPTKYNFTHAALAMNEYSEPPDYCCGPVWAIFDADAVQRDPEAARRLARAAARDDLDAHLTGLAGAHDVDVEPGKHVGPGFHGVGQALALLDVAAQGRHLAHRPGRALLVERHRGVVERMLLEQQLGLVADADLSELEALPHDPRWKQLEADYERRFLNPYVAADRGAVDAVIDPADTRQVVAAAFEVLATKREVLVARKHDNTPL